MLNNKVKGQFPKHFYRNDFYWCVYNYLEELETVLAQSLKLRLEPEFEAAAAAAATAAAAAAGDGAVGC